MSLAKWAKLSILIFFALFSISAFTQPIAEFQANITEGCAPLVVTFIDQSTGSPTSWNWDLGDGSFSSQQSPSATYVNPGTYTVKLTASNASGSNTKTKTAYIKVYASPVIDFTANPLSGCEPLTVDFTHSSIAGSGSIASIQWDFGDGYLDQEDQPTHVYQDGIFDVTLSITNSFGCSNTIVKNDYINVAAAPVANFNAVASSSCDLPVTVQFTNTTTGGATNTYSWDFGDGNTSTSINPTHVYNAEGNYTVRLIAISPGGCIDTIIKPSLLNIGSSAAQFNMPATVCANVPVEISFDASPAPNSITWDFGDGTIGTGSTNTHTFSTPGTYSVTMNANYPGCDKTATQTIIVGSGVNANFNSPNRMGCTVPHTVDFTNLSTGASSYSWSFGDGGTSTNATPSHTYSTMGNYHVTLIANGNGCSDTIRKNNFVRIADPVINLSQSPYYGCTPLNAQLGLSLNTSEAIASYQWVFHDGTTSTSATPNHTYSTPGVYPITVSVITESGCRDSLTVDSAVVVGQPFNINFNASPTNTCAQFPVNFSNTSTGLIPGFASFEWDFGDGGFSNLPSPSYMYNDTGFFTIKLIINNGGCIDSIIRTNYVYISPPIAAFSFDADCNNDTYFSFENNSIGADSVVWDFGDGNSSNEWSPSHQYDTLGNYNVTLTVWNDSTGCFRSQTQSIHAGSFGAEIAAFPREFCFPRPTKIKLINVDYSFIDTVKWLIPPNIVRYTDSVVYQFPSAGVFDITAIVKTVNGCWDTIVSPALIKAHIPKANFNVSNQVQCINTTTDFNDQSTVVAGDSIVNWLWEFGDGAVVNDTSQPFQHVYTDTGLYTVKLVVTDNFGCKDSIVRPNYIRVIRAKADFEADTLSCSGNLLQFTNLSEGVNLSYSWLFGDNTSSTQASPTHNYTTEGYYSVLLAVQDQFGCRDTIVKDNFVRVSNPEAFFTISDSLSTCPPLVVSFNNLSTNYNSVHWDFGNGNNSNIVNPTHTFFEPGNFTVTLTVNGYGNCQDQYQKQIKIGGPRGTLEYGPLDGCHDLPINITVHPEQENSSFIYDFRDGIIVSSSDTSASHVYTTPGIYVPRVILQDEQGCTVTIVGTDTIRVRGVEAEFSVADSIFCNAGIANFTNQSNENFGSILSYTWDFGDGTPLNHEENPSHQYTSPGQYEVQLSIMTVLGCRDTVTMPTPVIIKGDPQIAGISDTSSCLPFSINLSPYEVVPDTSAVTWQWNLPNGQSSNQQSLGAYDFSQAGTYNFTVIATNDVNCKDTLQATVVIHPDPDVDAGPNSFVCLGDSLNINATGALTYQWQTAPNISCLDCGNPYVYPVNAQTYFVTGTDANGCKNVDSIFVDVQHPFNLTVSDSAIICAGTAVNLLAQGSDLYTWTANPGGATFNSPNITVSPNITTTYTVRATDTRNCFVKTESVTIYVFPIPEVDAGEDISIYGGHPAVIVPILSNDITFLNWNPTTGIVAYDYPAITVMPQFSTTYTITVTNNGGCTAQDDIKVTVLCDASNFFLPNTFTPNGDGVNDIFYPRGVGLFSIKTFKIFNRWGEIVFERNNFQANDPNYGWDGTYKGKKQNDDVFVYYMEIICDNDYRISTKGNIALLK